jgi:cystathionine beta-lyase/cystathionine gamma-synthase
MLPGVCVVRSGIVTVYPLKFDTLNNRLIYCESIESPSLVLKDISEIHTIQDKSDKIIHETF